jgi:hypothetical protein
VEELMDYALRGVKSKFMSYKLLTMGTPSVAVPTKAAFIAAIRKILGLFI